MLLWQLNLGPGAPVPAPELLGPFKVEVLSGGREVEPVSRDLRVGVLSSGLDVEA